MRKAIYFVLDTLLVLGALLCVLTIDGGKWITSEQVMSIPSNAAVYNQYIYSNTQEAGETSTPQNSDEKVPNCSTVLMPNTSEWYTAYPMLDAYQALQDYSEQQKSQASGC